MKRVLLTIMVLVPFLSTSFAFLDFYRPGFGPWSTQQNLYEYEEEQYEEDMEGEDKLYLPSEDKIYRDEYGDYIKNNGTDRKYYLPPQKYIYRDERGSYIYKKMMKSRRPEKRRRRVRRIAGGSGGLHLRSMTLRNTQFDALNQQLSDDSVNDKFSNRNLVLFGGGAYWHTSKHFYFGGAGAGGHMSVGRGSDRGALSIGYGGLDFLILIPFGSNDFNVVFGALLGAGGLQVQSKANKYNKAFWIAEPKAGLQINFSSHFAMRILATYMMSQDLYAETEGTLSSSIDYDDVFSLKNLTTSIQFEWGLF